MSDFAAIPAGSVMETYHRLTDHPKIKTKTQQEQKIASLVNSDGFKALQEYIDSQITLLSEIAIDPRHDTPETVGFRYLVTSATISYLKSIRDLPKRYHELLKEDHE